MHWSTTSLKVNGAPKVEITKNKIASIKKQRSFEVRHEIAKPLITEIKAFLISFDRFTPFEDNIRNL